MQTNPNVERFVEAQNSSYDGYETALAEIRAGKKTGHWIWYIFPQLRSLGHSHQAHYYGIANSYACCDLLCLRSHRTHYYGIANKTEALHYLQHPLLGARLREITKSLLTHKDKTALSILGNIDALKVRSCMTLFDILSPNDIFAEVLKTFYKAERCQLTLKVMQEE